MNRRKLSISVIDAAQLPIYQCYAHDKFDIVNSFRVPSTLIKTIKKAPKRFELITFFLIFVNNLENIHPRIHHLQLSLTTT